MYKFKLLTSFLLLEFIFFSAFGATFTSQSTGNWDTGSTWNIGVPDLKNNDIVVVSTGNTVIKTGNLIVNTNNLVFNIYGVLVIDGTLDVKNNLIFNIFPGGSVTITNLSAEQNSNIDISGGGSLTVTNDLTLGNNADINVDGILSVEGDINTGNNSDLTGSGTVIIGGTCDDGGSGTFCESGPLPVELISFTANPQGKKVVLSWATASELNNDYFTLEKSRNGKEFEVLTKVDGNGTTHIRTDYQYSDQNPFLGLSYYRLRQTDYDGTSETFPAVSVLFTASDQFSVFPNPIKNQSLGIKISGRLKHEILELKVFNLQGRLILKKQFVADAFGNLDTTLDVGQQFDKGAYILELVTATGIEHIKVQYE